MKIKGLKKSVGDYQRANSGGCYSPIYGYLMYDHATGAIWMDVFCSLGHNSWKKYQSESIVNIGRMMGEKNIPVTMKNVQAMIERNFLK